MAVRSLTEKLRLGLSDLILRKDKELVRPLRAAGHAQRYHATDTKHGRPGKWKREDLLKVAAQMDDILDRETSSHIYFASFVDHYLRLLDFPFDVIEVTEKEYINLYEAEQFARVPAKHLGIGAAQAKRTRADTFIFPLANESLG
jgi:hypothetical protein